MPYWVRFSKPIKVHNSYSGKDVMVMGACIHSNFTIKDPEMRYIDVKARASSFGEVKEILPLPYGARPSLDEEQPGDFCSSPDKCAGHSSCPKNYACSE